MGRIYLGQWELVVGPDTGAAAWWPPQRERLVGSWLDLRGRDRNGYGLFCYDGPVLDRLLALDLGDDLEGVVGPAQRIALETLLRVSLAGRRLVDVVYELLGGQADPSRSQRAAPLLATRKLEYLLRLGDFPVQRRGFDGFESLHGVKGLAVEQADYRRVRESVLAGRSRSDQHRRLLGFLVRKYRLVDYRVFIPEDLPDEEPLEPRTTLTESFNTADSSTLGPDQTWTEFISNAAGNGWTIVSNKAENLGVDGSPVEARAEADLSGADHYCQASCESVVGAVFIGVCCRFENVASPDLYIGAYRDSTSLSYIIRKWFNGALSTVASLNEAVAPGNGPITLKLTVDGSDLTLEADSVSKVTTTDTDITGHLRCGIHAEAGDNRTRVDVWEAADLAAAGARRVVLIG